MSARAGEVDATVAIAGINSPVKPATTTFDSVKTGAASVESTVGNAIENAIENVDNEDENAPPKESIVPAKTQARRLPPPNISGSIGTVPLEAVHVNELKKAPSREKNLYDTSLDVTKKSGGVTNQEKLSIKEMINKESLDTFFPWREIGEFNSSGKNKNVGNNSKAIKDYIIETFFNDWWHDASPIIGTCFFSWLFAYYGFSWWSLILIFSCTASVYSLEYSRFARNLRDDLKRSNVSETISKKSESSVWLNTLLSKIWLIHMPVISEQVMAQANPILAESAPGYGIDSLSLEEFTLGSKAPAIRSIKTNSKSGKDITELELSFAFTPSDVSDMTPREVREKVNPRIVLGVTLGKSFVSKTVPIIVEDINVSGRVRLITKFGQTFPNIKTVSVQLLEAPMIDFALKPIGGDTLGLDVMSFLPGLKSFVKGMVNSTIGPMMIAPNKFDIDIEDILAAQSNEAIGVIAVSIYSASHLKSSEFIGNTVDPYVVLSTSSTVQGSSNTVRTSIKSDVKDPRWNETKYMLVSTLDQKLTFQCYDFNDLRKDNIIGEFDLDLSELLQNPTIENASSVLRLGVQSRGTLQYAINWFPVIKDSESERVKSLQQSKTMVSFSDDEDIENESDEEDLKEKEIDTNVGILKFTLESIRSLDLSYAVGGVISPSAELRLNGRLVKRYRTLKKTNEPSWNETIELFVNSKSSSVLELTVFDERSKRRAVLCSIKASLATFFEVISIGQDYINASPKGQIYFFAQWKPVDSHGSIISTSVPKTPIGALRFRIHDALVKDSLKGVGDIDPYFNLLINNQIYYRSRYISENKNPSFDTTVYLPITSENDVIALSLFDYQNVGKDRFIGRIQFHADKLIEAAIKKENNNLASTESEKWVLRDLRNRATNDHVNVAVGYIPIIPVFSPTELEHVNELEKEMREKKEAMDKEQSKLKEEMEKKPSDYEIVEIPYPFEDTEKEIASKKKYTYDELVHSEAGIITFEIISGTLSSPTSFLQILVDDVFFPAYTSSRSKNGKLSKDSGFAFIRDLANSTVLVRISRKQIVKDKENIIAEFSIKTLKLLKNSYEQPYSLNVAGSIFSIRCLFDPSSMPMPSCEKVGDTGMLKLGIISGTNLLASDRNGKSDPYVDILVNNHKVFTTEIIKKTLNPVWNETAMIPIPSRKYTKIIADVYDWDRATENDPLGYTPVEISQMESNKLYEWDLVLSTQGSIKVTAEFVPQYIRPIMEIREVNKKKQSLKAVGNVAGAGLGAATGGVHVGGKILKKGIKGEFNSKEKDMSEEMETAQRISIEQERAVPDLSYAPIPENTLAQPPTPSSPTRSNLGVPPGHTRNPSAASSFARTLAPNGTYRGIVTILATENLSKNVQVKVSLTQKGRMKSLFKTKPQKTDDDGIAHFNENCEFKASPEANLVFGVVAHHKLSKDRDLGLAQINLGDPQIQNEGNIAIKIGEGRIIVKIDYGHDGDASDIPPVPKIPQEHMS
ncbi:hypothetical protein Kpol_1001p6 [Vanderwaltozyma polyspora DSM 70294]|uniref:Tricalbin-3 n=1 Tax=Vanderwaltozyma polyspora (strain ATCC 22028 / DSM 70294 / BCRC 21397 / CBS 2163 / NBRC 10782 / NRRL Y-8283 / UCD 57-17) TaxID=436907 RepID=A7TNP3_VANPO|nr:uncharacterized protein Kpol_1001p6 [Vanderwaltozyma polyspora DSM 70294]EDO16094.1 hypothetical protein Kpol_1001p6 [Vanderwaltozyma polyspora DSM 70294]